MVYERRGLLEELELTELWEDLKREGPKKKLKTQKKNNQPVNMKIQRCPASKIRL